MKTATAAIAVPIQISVQRSLLAAEVVVAVGDTATSTDGPVFVGTFATSVCAPPSVTVAWAAASDLDIWNRIVNGPLGPERGSLVTESTDTVSFCCDRVVSG